jgi:signal transduction histidine kinase/putative methionine-R-sulfoxide reductase with GAF domain
MAKTRIPKIDEKLILEDKIRGQYEKLFSGAEEPPAPMSIRQVEALKARVAELEEELEKRSTVVEVVEPPSVSVAEYPASQSEEKLEKLPAVVEPSNKPSSASVAETPASQPELVETIGKDLASAIERPPAKAAISQERPLTASTMAAENIEKDDLTVASRTASAILDTDGVGLYQQMSANIEKRVAERTHGLELAWEISRLLTQKTTALNVLLKEAVDLIRERFNLYYIQIYLADAAGRALILRAGTGEVGAELLRRGHRLLVGPGSINGQAAAQKHSLIVKDTKQSADYLLNPLLPNTRSEMAVPLIASGQVLGVLNMQAEQPDALNESNLAPFETLAGQISIAIQNANLFAEAEEARSEVQAQVRRLTERGWQEFLDAIERGQKVGFAFDQQDVVPLQANDLSESTIENALNVPITVTNEQIGVIQLGDELNRVWTGRETEIVQAAARQLAQHIENLRLLAQADRYRNEAEQSARRLTHEGWDVYLQSRGEQASGYIFDLNQVQPLAKSSNGISGEILKYPLVVRDEAVGELTVDSAAHSDGAAEIIAAVAQQLSGHIENLRLNEELQKRAEALQELDRLKSSFLANMSHELRTPLNSILGFSDVILEGIDGPLTEHMDNDLRLIQRNSQHLLHLINDVLDMAKIESGRMNLNLEKFKINDMLDEVLNITSTLSGEKNLPVYIESGSENVEILADSTRIKQVMINVINNSIKFTDKGEVKISCRKSDPETVRIAVKDTGIGIPAGQLETIFQEFAQVDSSATRKVGGTGLGLPISRRLVELHGGRLWAESSGIAGEGSVFLIELPLKARISEAVETTAK